MKLKLSELAKKTGYNLTTLRYYSNLGLLEYDQAGSGKLKYYDLEVSRQRLAEIYELKIQGKSIEEIVERLG